MTYDPGIPKPGNDIAEDQPKILVNFQQLNTQFGVNHGAFDDGTVPGKHKHVTLVELSQAEIDALEPKNDEIILYGAEDSAGNTEIYSKQHQQTATQFTKAGIPFIGMKPQASANFGPGAGPFPRAAVVSSSFNVGSVSETADGQYTVTYTNDIVDATGAGTNNYYWSIQGFDDQNNPVIGSPETDSVYGDVVKKGSIKVDFRNQNGTLVSSLTRGQLIIWSVQ